MVCAKQVRKWENIRLRSELERRAESQASAVRTQVELYKEGLYSLRNLIHYPPKPSYEAFSQVASNIYHRLPGLQVLEWVPVVRGPERESFESATRSEGMSGFRISDAKSKTNLVAAASRPVYWPVQYAFPLKGNERALGYDLQLGPSAPMLKRIAEKAELGTSGGLVLVQDDERQLAMILALPVYSGPALTPPGREALQRLRGFVQIIFRVDDAFETALGNIFPTGLNSVIVDETAPDAPSIIHQHRSRNSPKELPFPSVEEIKANRAYDLPLLIGTRSTRIYFQPTETWLRNERNYSMAITVVSGLLLTILITAYLRSAAGRAEKVSSLVEKRTTELTAANLRLEREVADRKSAEEALRVSEERFARAVQGSNDGIWDRDFVTGRTYFSPRWKELLGYSWDEVPSTSEFFYERLHPDEHETVRKEIQKHLEQHTPYNVDMRVRHKNGEYRWFNSRGQAIWDENGKPIRMAGAMTDLTERKHAEEMLARERSLLRTLIDTLPDYIFVKDTQGRFLMTNEANRRLLGAESVAEIIGKTIHAYCPAKLAESYSADDQKVIKTGQPVLNREEPYTLPGGGDGWFLTTKMPLLDSSGKVVGIVGVSHDITLRRRAEQEKLALDQKLQETQKLESLGVLAGGIAHDFNNLLTGILGNASLARMGLASDVEAQIFLKRIEETSQRAADLCKQMLAYAGKGRFVVQHVNISTLVESTMQLLQVSAAKGCILKYDLAPNLPAVAADITQLRQIIMNLVINAAEAIGTKSGIITLRTGLTRADRRYLSATYLAPDLPEGDYVYLEVSDTGCGMDAETKARIFDPFFTTKFTGRGLGLAAVLGIVRGHRGALKVYSEPGRGSTFKLLLPCVEGFSEDLESKRTAETSEWRGTGTILVVDDEETVATVSARMLEAFGFKVLVAHDGIEGVETFRNSKSSITLILMDLTMPRMDGEQTFRELRRLKGDVKVILMSGFNEQEAIARFTGKGLAGFLQKPFKPEDLRDKLQEILG